MPFRQFGRFQEFLGRTDNTRRSAWFECRSRRRPLRRVRRADSQENQDLHLVDNVTLRDPEPGWPKAGSTSKLSVAEGSSCHVRVPNAETLPSMPQVQSRVPSSPSSTASTRGMSDQIRRIKPPVLGSTTSPWHRTNLWFMRAICLISWVFCPASPQAWLRAWGRPWVESWPVRQTSCQRLSCWHPVSQRMEQALI